jgi:hypothetical protein
VSVPLCTLTQQIVCSSRYCLDAQAGSGRKSFRPPKTGTLDFTPEDELGMADLIADETVAASKLLGPGS